MDIPAKFQISSSSSDTDIGLVFKIFKPLQQNIHSICLVVTTFVFCFGHKEGLSSDL